MTRRALYAADLAGWPRRVPTSVLTVGVPAVFGLLLLTVLVAPSDYPATIQEATSWSTFLDEAWTGFAIAGALAAWWAPRLSGWALVAGTLPVVGDPGLPFSFKGLAVIWAAVMLLDTALIVRQRAGADWLRPVEAGPVRWTMIGHGRWFRVVVVTLLVVATAYSMVRYVQWRSDLLALERRAVAVPGTVLDRDSFDDSLKVRYDGKVGDFFVNDASEHPVGSQITIMVDPAGQMAPYNAEDADPDSWSSIGALLFGSLALIYLAVVEAARRRRRILWLANADDPGVDVLVRRHAWSGGLEVYAADDRTGARPLLYLPGMEPLVRAGTAEQDAVPDEYEELDLPGIYGGELLGAFGDDLVAAHVRGLAGDGSLCVVVRTEEGSRPWANLRPARDRWTVRALRTRGRRPELPDPPPADEELDSYYDRDPDDVAPEDVEAVPVRTPWFLRLAAGTAVPGLVALCAAPFVVLPWYFDGDSPWPEGAFLAFVVGSLAHSWLGLIRRPVRRSRFGLLATGTVLDTRLDAHRILGVRRGLLTIAVDLEGGGKQVLTVPLGTGTTEAAALLDEAEVAVTDARQRSSTSRPPGPRRLPAPALVGGLVVAVCWILAALTL